MELKISCILYKIRNIKKFLNICENKVHFASKEFLFAYGFKKKINICIEELDSNMNIRIKAKRKYTLLFLFYPY